MACSLAGVTLSGKERPYDGVLSYQGEAIWSEARPLFYKGRIMRKAGTDAIEHQLFCMWGSTTKNAIQAIVDADGDAEVAFVWTDGDIGITSQTVSIKKFAASKNRKTIGTTLWDVELVLVVAAGA